MKATHNKAIDGKVEWKFPCLGIGKDGDVIVLFTEHGKGTALMHPKTEAGYYSISWTMSHFTPIPSTESVILQND